MLNVEIKNLKELQTALARSEKVVAPTLSNAINAVLQEILKESRDPNFEFKFPRSMRTGFLAQSFAQGIKQSTPATLQGSIGPTVYYAPFVQYGTYKQKPNPFMERIVKIAQPAIDKQWSNALDIITRKLFESI